MNPDTSEYNYFSNNNVNNDKNNYNDNKIVNTGIEINQDSKYDFYNETNPTNINDNNIINTNTNLTNYFKNFEICLSITCIKCLVYYYIYYPEEFQNLISKITNSDIKLKILFFVVVTVALYYFGREIIRNHKAQKANIIYNLILTRFKSKEKLFDGGVYMDESEIILESSRYLNMSKEEFVTNILPEVADLTCKYGVIKIYEHTLNNESTENAVIGHEIFNNNIYNVEKESVDKTSRIWVWNESKVIKKNNDNDNNDDDDDDDKVDENNDNVGICDIVNNCEIDDNCEMHDNCNIDNNGDIDNNTYNIENENHKGYGDCENNNI